MLGYVASCLGLSPTARDPPPSTEPLDSSPTRSAKKPLTADDVNAAAAAASYAAAAAVILPASLKLDRVPPVCSSENIEKRVVKRPTRLFISRRSAHRSEFFINLSAKREKEVVCLSEGNIPFRLSPFEGQLTVVRKRRRFRSDTMDQNSNGCDIPRSRNSNRRRTSRSPGCYLCEADAYASLEAAGWTCTTTESMVPASDQIQYLYHMPYFPPAQAYQQYPVEFEAQYLEYSHSPNTTYVTYSPSSPPPNLAQSPRTVIQCPPCQQCPLPRMQRSPPKPLPYDRGLCESVDMANSISDSLPLGHSSSRSTKKTSQSQRYYSVPFEDDAPQFPSREGEDAEERRWKSSRQRHPRDWRDTETLDTQRSSNNTLWSRVPSPRESRNNSEKESRQTRFSSESTGKGYCRPSSLVSTTRRKRLPSERSIRNTEMATQTSVAPSREFVAVDDEEDIYEEEEEPATVATQTSLQVLVIDRKKDWVDGDNKIPSVERRLSPSYSSRSPRLSQRLSPRQSQRLSPRISPRTSIVEPEVDETLQSTSHLSPTEIELPPTEGNEESSDVSIPPEEGSRKEAGRDFSPTMSFSTEGSSFPDQYVTPPLILCEANNHFKNDFEESPGILGELSTELQALAARVAMLEKKRSMGNSETFIPAVMSEPIGNNVEPFTVWHKERKYEGSVQMEDSDEDEEILEDNGEMTKECDTFGSYDQSPNPRRIHRHTCSFSDIGDAGWVLTDCQTTGYTGDANNGATIPMPGLTKESSSSGWCNATNIGIARSSPNLHSILQPSTRTPVMSTSNEEYACGHEPETVRGRTGGMVAVQAMAIHPTLGLGNSHWKKIHMEVGVGDWDFATSAWSAGVTGPIEEPKNIQMTKEAGEGGEGGENYHSIPPPPPPSPLPSPVGDGAATAEHDRNDHFKMDDVEEVQIVVEEAEQMEKVQAEDGEVEEKEDVARDAEKAREEEEKASEEEEKCLDENSGRELTSTPFLLDSVLFPPMKASPAATPFIPSMENLRKRCLVSKEEVEKITSSTQTLMKASLDSDHLQLFSAFQRVVVLGESKLDEGLGLMDNVAIEIDLCRLEAITHIAYVVMVVFLFLLLTTLLSFIVN